MTLRQRLLLLTGLIALTVVLQFQTIPHKPYIQITVTAAYPDPDLSTHSVQMTENLTFGYVMVLKYEGQQTGAAGSLASLQCWIKSFELPLHIVEPMVQRSYFVNNDTPGKDTLWFSDLFSRQHFNIPLVGKREQGQLKSWTEFMENAPRSIVYVQIKDPSPHSQDYGPSHIDWEVMENITGCFAPEKLEFLKQYGFCVVKVVHFAPHGGNPWNTKIYLDGSELYSPFTAEHVRGVMMHGQTSQDVTMVFDQWLPMYCIPNPNSTKKEVCRNVHWTGRRLIHPSQQLLRDVEQYEALFLMPRTALAVLIRSEHLVTWIGHMQTSPANLKVMEQTIHSYLKELTDRAASLMNSHPNGKIFVTVDVGKYGSSGWSTVFGRRRPYRELRVPILEAVKDTVYTLYKYRWTFEDTFTQVVSGKRMKDRGYIAALQRTIASRADCLVLLGGGSFGLVAIHEYARHHPNHSKQCVHLVGMPSWYRKIYEQALNSSKST